MVKRRSDHSLFKKAGNSVKKSKYFQSKKRASYGSQVESKKPASTDGKDDECSCSHSDCPGLQEECQEKFLVYGCRSGCSSVDSCISSAVSNVEQERVPTLEGMTPSSGCHVDQFIKKECLVTPDTYTDMPRVQEASTSTTTDTAPLASGGLLSSSRIITADDAVQALDTVNQLLNLRECHVQDLKRERNELSIKVSSLTAETEELRRKLSEQNNLIINLKKELQMNDERRNSESAALQGEIIQLKHKISMMEESRHAFNERIDVLLNGMSTEMNTSEEISSFDSGKSSHSISIATNILPEVANVSQGGQVQISLETSTSEVMKDECFQMNFISDEINLEGRPEPLSYSQSSAMSSEVEIIQEHVGSIANYLSSLRPVSTFIQEPGFGDILKEGRSSIVRWSEIVEPNTILKETYDLKSIGELFKPPSLSLSGLKWLAARRLIRNSVNCSSCHSSCILVRRNMLPDRYEWECPCGQKISVRSGSIFRDCGLSISRIVGLMYCFCMGYSVHLVVPRNETNGKAIATKWYQLFREISQMLDVPDKSAKNAFSQFISYIAKHYPVEHQT